MIAVGFRTEAGGRAKAEIRFRPPTNDGLDIIRSVPGRKYDHTTRSWSIPAHRLPQALQRFHAAGLAVEVNQRPWSPSPPAPPEPDDKLAALFKELPDRLVQPTVLALGRVWDENDAWMIRLRDATTTWQVGRSGGRVRRLRRRSA
jgi:hypothetical protein